MKKKICGVVLVLALGLGMSGCASWNRMVTDMKSDIIMVCRERLMYTQQMVKSLQPMKEKLTLKPMMVDMLSLIIKVRDTCTTIAL